MPTTRRSFLRATTAAAAAPLILPTGLLRAEANSKINIGLIGCGSRGTGVMKGFLQKDNVQVVAVCDVDTNHEGSRKGAGKHGTEPVKALVEAHYAAQTESGTYSGCDTYSDFRELCAREDIDAVIVGTPDHWHALAAIEAVRNSKDVYCEKPITHLFAEGTALYKEVAKHNRIFQTGSQQRSDIRFHRAVEIVQNGLLGKISHVEVGLPSGRTGTDGPSDVTTIPDNLDYDFYCGPMQDIHYNAARCHWSWRWHTNFGGGQLMDWIGHHNDIAHWSMGLDKSGPTSVESTDWEMFEGDLYDTPVKYTVKSTYADDFHITMSTENRMGITWYGEDDVILYVTRGKIECFKHDGSPIPSQPSKEKGGQPQPKNLEFLAESYDRGPIKPYVSKSHDQNFIDGILNRTECICPAETAHRSITPGHLGWLSHKLGRKLNWDPTTETITGDDDANTQLNALNYRGDWKL